MAALIQVTRTKIINLDRVEEVDFVRAPADVRGPDRLLLHFASPDHSEPVELLGVTAAAAWDLIQRSCSGPIDASEWTPAAVRRLDLDVIADVVDYLRIAHRADDGTAPGLDPVTAGYLADRLESARASIAAARRRPAADEPADGEDDPPAPSYAILGLPAGAPVASGPYRDLGALHSAARRLAAAGFTGPYPIDSDGASWGALTIRGADDWSIEATGDTVTILPGAMIL